MFGVLVLASASASGSTKIVHGLVHGQIRTRKYVRSTVLYSTVQRTVLCCVEAEIKGLP